jgi:hypothetical protein
VERLHLDFFEGTKLLVKYICRQNKLTATIWRKRLNSVLSARYRPAKLKLSLSVNRSHAKIDRVLLCNALVVVKRGNVSLLFDKLSVTHTGMIYIVDEAQKTTASESTDRT